MYDVYIYYMRANLHVILQVIFALLIPKSSTKINFIIYWIIMQVIFALLIPKSSTEINFIIYWIIIAIAHNQS